MYRLFIILYGLLLSIQTFSSPQTCQNLFETKKLIKESNDTILLNINRRLKAKKSPYKIENKRLIYVDPHTQQTIEVADVHVIEPKYLFEYATKSYNEYWLKNGVNKSDMDLILSSHAQAYGRGYYISLSATDSRSFGNYLTVFEVDKPMVVLKLKNVYNLADRSLRLHDDKEFLNVMRGVGVAALKGNDTWYSIINEDYLKSAKNLDRNSFEYALSLGIDAESRKKLLINESRAQALFNFNSLKYVKNISKDVIGYHEILKKSVSELTKIDMVLLKMFLKDDTYNLLNELAKTQNGIKIFKKMLANFKLEELNDVIVNLSGNSSALSKINIQLKKMLQQIPLGSSFFELFDLVDVALSDKKQSEFLTINQMLKAAQSYDLNLNGIDLKQIYNHESFFQAFQKVHDLKTAVRGDDLIMASRIKNKYTLSLSSKFSRVLSENPLLKINIEETKQSNQFSEFNEVSVNYFSIDNYNEILNLLTPAEVSKLKPLLSQNLKNVQIRKNANRELIKILLPKFFDAKYFAQISQLMGSHTDQIDLFILYKAFISLHPYESGNGRAARFYYKWLIKNHLNKDIKSLKLLFNDSDLMTSLNFYTDREVVELTWYLGRLWIMTSTTQSEMIKKSKKALEFMIYYQDEFLNMGDEAQLLK